MTISEIEDIYNLPILDLVYRAVYGRRTANTTTQAKFRYARFFR